jgi:hypothetical protein
VPTCRPAAKATVRSARSLQPPSANRFVFAIYPLRVAQTTLSTPRTKGASCPELLKRTANAKARLKRRYDASNMDVARSVGLGVLKGFVTRLRPARRRTPCRRAGRGDDRSGGAKGLSRAAGGMRTEGGGFQLRALAQRVNVGLAEIRIAVSQGAFCRPSLPPMVPRLLVLACRVLYRRAPETLRTGLCRQRTGRL